MIMATPCTKSLGGVTGRWKWGAQDAWRRFKVRGAKLA